MIRLIPLTPLLPCHFTIPLSLVRFLVLFCWVSSWAGYKLLCLGQLLKLLGRRWGAGGNRTRGCHIAARRTNHPLETCIIRFGVLVTISFHWWRVKSVLPLVAGLRTTSHRWPGWDLPILHWWRVESVLPLVAGLRTTTHWWPGWVWPILHWWRVDSVFLLVAGLRMTSH